MSPAAWGSFLLRELLSRGSGPWIKAVDQGRGSNGQSESDGIEQLELG
jgi:hypothetical protein